jgi:hypothetical protein
LLAGLCVRSLVLRAGRSVGLLLGWLVWLVGWFLVVWFGLAWFVGLVWLGLARFGLASRMQYNNNGSKYTIATH